MGNIRTTMAALLSVLVFTAFQSDADAQARRGESRSTVSQDRKTSVSRQPSQAARSSSAQKRTSAVTKPSNQTRPSSATRPAGTSNVSKSNKDDRKPSTTVRRPAADRPSASARPSAQTRPSSQARPSNQAEPSRPVATDRSSVKKPSVSAKEPISVTRPGNRADRADRPVPKPTDGRPAVRHEGGRTNSAVRADREEPVVYKRPSQTRPDRKPDVRRVHPRDRDFMEYNRPSHFWSGHNHCFGHRVRILPSHARRHIHFGVTYYCYNDIWYRPYGGYYVVCRPPFGTVLAADIIADMAWSAVRLSYYYTVANTYSQINENNRYIAEQNAVIAQNNATIAAQNQTIAMNQQLASQAYTLANDLGLIQSYAAAGSDYYYQDGVFYAMGPDGEYKVIVPPAGALVDTLPEDYDMVTLKGNEYYKVDDTVYKVAIVEGKPYFEVLGQLLS